MPINVMEEYDLATGKSSDSNLTFKSRWRSWFRWQDFDIRLEDPIPRSDISVFKLFWSYSYDDFGIYGDENRDVTVINEWMKWWFCLRFSVMLISGVCTRSRRWYRCFAGKKKAQ
jgi:hypothetical protein